MNTEILQSLQSNSCFFTDQESLVISKKIQEFRDNPKSRSGGSAIQKELEKVTYFREGLLLHLNRLDLLLNPENRVSKPNLVEVIDRVAEGFKSLPEKVLRTLAHSILGEKEQEFTMEELPYAIAAMQVSQQEIVPGESK